MFRRVLLASMIALGLATAGVASAVPPEPVPYHEVVPVAPGAGAVWVPGHWDWRPFQGRYVWEAGFWQATSPTVVFRAPIVVGHPWHRPVVAHPVHRVVVVKHRR